MPEQVFFGYQLVILENAKEGLRSDFHDLIESKSADDSPYEKLSFFKSLAGMMAENFYAAEYGFWDSSEGAKASEDFDQWVAEITAGLATEDAETVDADDEGYIEPDIDRISSDKNYIAVTALMLIERSAANEAFYKRLSSLDESLYYDKETFRRLLDLFSMIDYEHVVADAIFLAPGNDEDGLSWEDIHGEGWQYLRPIL